MTTVAVASALSVLLLAALAGDAAITPATGPTAEPTRAESAVTRRLVFINTYAVNWSVFSGVPSGEISLFLGSSLRPRARRNGGVWTTALGYELTLSAGAADRLTAFYSFPGPTGRFYHRHHLTAAGFGARDDRLYYAFGGGVLLYNSTPTALEADVRLGCVLGVRRPTRVKGVVGGQARIVGVLHGVPLPEFGVFAGLLLF